MSRIWFKLARISSSIILTAFLIFGATGSVLALTGSTFQSADGNLDGTATLHDWNPAAGGNLGPVEPIDCANGVNCGIDPIKSRTDNALGQGAKNDDENPAVVYGSIPPNKDDLSRFYVNVERVGDDDFLYLAWERSNLLGSAHVDFELNQGNELADNLVTLKRTEDDILIDFDFSGSGDPVLALHRWVVTGDPTVLCEVSNSLPCWGKATILTNLPDVAEAEVNSVPVLDYNPPDAPITLDGNTKNGINSTFGEAGINLTKAGIFSQEKCQHFGHASLKSRSSGNSFNSELKDFIAPIPVNITNCGAVIIRKETIPEENPNTSVFGYTTNLQTDPQMQPTFTLLDDGANEIFNVFFGIGYTVVEDVIPSGYELDHIDCSASKNVTAIIQSATVTFDIDAATDVLDCTYYNRAKGTIIVEKVTYDAIGSFVFTSGTLPESTFTLTTTAVGLAGKDVKTFPDLSTGTYDVAETIPAGWNLDSATCDDGSNPATIGLDAGETVTCTFVDKPERGAILVTKTHKFAAAGPGAHPQAGVTFTVNGVSKVTDASGQACFDNLLLSSFAGAYTVTETVPAGYVADGPTSKTVSVTAEATCAAGPKAQVSFSNTPLTNITVSVDSQVAGGTNSTIECVLVDEVVGSADAGDDISVTMEDLLPGTYICTIVVDP